jgi:putative effector of murein hydrolase
MPAGTAGWVLITLAAYFAALTIDLRCKHALLSPMLVGSALLIVALAASGTTTAEYAEARTWIGSLVGPAMLAPAVTLYKKRALILRNFAAIGTALAAGSLLTLLAAIAVAHVLGLPSSVASALGLKSVTAPVAVAIASKAHLDTGMTALAVFLTARFGDAFGPALLNLAQVRDPIARGLSMGCIATAGGVARIAREDEGAAATGAAAVGVIALALAATGGFVLPALAGGLP